MVSGLEMLSPRRIRTVRRIGVGLDVLLVCADQTRRREIAAVLEKRGLLVSQAQDSRAAIGITIGNHIRMAVIIGNPADPYTGALINCLWTNSAHCKTWFVGVPSQLRLTEIVREYHVAVLPAPSTAQEIERTMLARSPRTARRAVDWMRIPTDTLRQSGQ